MERKVFGLICATIFFLGVSSAVQAISVTDYKVPVSTAASAFGGFGYKYSSDITGNKTSDQGNLSLTYARFYSSLPFGYRLGLNGIGSRDGLAAEDSVYTYNLAASAQANKYLFKGKDFFGFGKTDMVTTEAYDNPAVKVTAGLGWGRFINATPLVRALRVEEELRREGVLTKKLVDSMRLRLARKLAPDVMNEYMQEHEYWEREYYKDLEELLKKSGKLRDNELGAVGTRVISDVLEEYISDRYYGWDISAGIGYELVTPYKDADRNAYAELNLNFAYPLSLRSQFVEFFTISSPMTDGKFGKEVSFSLTPTFSYEISNYLDFLASYILTGNKFDEPEAETETNHEMRFTLAYYVVNRLVLTNTFTLSHPHGAESVAKSFSTGLSYRLR